MERDVSFVTGRRVQHALERLGHEVYPLDIEDPTTGTLMELKIKQGLKMEVLQKRS